MRYRLLTLGAVVSALVGASRFLAGDAVGALGWITAAVALYTLSTKEGRRAERQ